MVPAENADERSTTPPTRIATLVLVSAEGDVLGRLPAFPVETPWWQEASPVVAGARERFGLDVTILRLLETEKPSAHGGAVTYLVEADPARVAAAGPGLNLQAWHGDLAEDPHRQPYASPGGPAADLAWADAVLARLGRSRRGPAEQNRTWNLSSLWCLPLADGAAWLKVVPPFFEHEGAPSSNVSEARRSRGCSVMIADGCCSPRSAAAIGTTPFGPSCSRWSTYSWTSSGGGWVGPRS